MYVYENTYVIHIYIYTHILQPAERRERRGPPLTPAAGADGAVVHDEVGLGSGSGPGLGPRADSGKKNTRHNNLVRS